MATDSPDRGFILPAVLVGLTFLYMTAAAGYTLAALETRMSDAHAASVRAFYIADGAVHDAVATLGDSLPSRSYDFGGGNAFVEIAPLLRTSAGVRLARVIGTARLDSPREGPAMRRVEVVALWAPGGEASATLVAIPGTWREIMDW